MECDRCNFDDGSVVVRTNCEICGPTPLCDECHKIHLGEIQIEQQEVDDDR